MFILSKIKHSKMADIYRTNKVLYFHRVSKVGNAAWNKNAFKKNQITKKRTR